MAQFYIWLVVFISVVFLAGYFFGKKLNDYKEWRLADTKRLYRSLIILGFFWKAAIIRNTQIDPLKRADRLEEARLVIAAYASVIFDGVNLRSKIIENFYNRKAEHIVNLRRFASEEVEASTHYLKMKFNFVNGDLNYRLGSKPFIEVYDVLGPGRLSTEELIRSLDDSFFDQDVEKGSTLYGVEIAVRVAEAIEQLEARLRVEEADAILTASNS